MYYVCIDPTRSTSSSTCDSSTGVELFACTEPAQGLVLLANSTNQNTLHAVTNLVLLFVCMHVHTHVCRKTQRSPSTRSTHHVSPPGGSEAHYNKKKKSISSDLILNPYVC